MNNYEKALSGAEKDLEKYVEREDWSTANQKQGYRDGIASYKNDLEYDRKWSNNSVVHHTRSAELEIQSAITEKKYGDAAYWRSFLNGRMSAETACRLDELETMVK